MAEKTDKHGKSRLRIYSEYFGFLLLYQLFKLLPLKAGYALSIRLVRMLFYIDHRHRRRTIAHILYAGAAGSESEARRIAKSSYDQFAKLLVEIVKMNQLYSRERILLTAPREVIDLVTPERNSGNRQSIVVTAHLGNWEVAGTAFAERSGTPMFSLMRPFDNPLVGRLILNHRQSDVHILIDKRLGIRPVLKALNEGRIATLLIDQHAAASEGVECIFFGHPARVHMTPALLHLKTGVPILPEITVRKPGDDFTFALRFSEPIRYESTGDKKTDIQRLTQRCITALEKLIREEPEQWLWTTRHWLDLDRRNAADYADWKPPQVCLEAYEEEMARNAPVFTVDWQGREVPELQPQSPANGAGQAAESGRA